MNPILLATIIVAGVGLIAGLVLAIASIFMEVKNDERFDKVRALLPGVNCGACGFSGCDSYAEALIEGKTKAGLCAPGGVEINQQIGEILGVSVEHVEPKMAVVQCNGTCKSVGNKMLYTGVQTCKAANMLYSGTLACNFGCLGLGDCQKACQYGAISVRDGVAVVDTEKCTACSACVKTCPKGLIELMPRSSTFAKVICSNMDKGAVARKVCEVACIGCGKCVKSCEYGAVTLKDNLARIDPYKCTACKECVENCPTGCISF